jgi:hypothetical protein
MHAFRSVIVSFAAVAALVACKPDKHEVQTQSPEAANAERVKHGETLVRMGGCSDCHTPMAFDAKLGMPVPIKERFLSGHPEGAPDPTGNPGKGDQAVIGPTFTSFRLPFGVVYSANLTSDRETGLGTWSEAQFKRVMRSGVHKGDPDGRPVLPPMPWMNLSQSSDEDLGAIFAFLQSLPPVKNKVPDPAVPAPVLTEIKKSYAQLAHN